MHRHTMTAGATLAVAALTLAACGGPGAQDDDGPIPIGVISDLSGATGDVGTPYSEGIRGYTDWLNEQGGIEGREIDLNLNDYAYDVARSEQLYSQYVNEGAVAIQGWGTADTEALQQRVTQDELPFMSASYTEELVDADDAPYNFLVAATYSDQMRVGLNWIAEDADGDAEVAVFHHDSPFGTSPVADGEAHIEDNDLGMGYESYAMPDGATDYVAQLGRASSQGAEYIVIQNVSSPSAMLASNIAQQDLDMTVVCLNWCADEQFIELAGEAAEGHMMVQPFAPPSDPLPGHEDMASFLESQGDSLDEKGLHYGQGWYTMHVMAEGIRHLITTDQDVTGPNLGTALREMDTVDTGEVTAPVDFSADSNRGTEGTGVYEVRDGELAEVERGATP